MKISFLRVIRVAAPCARRRCFPRAIFGDSERRGMDQELYRFWRANVHVDTNDGSVRVTTGDTKQVELRVIYNGYTLDRIWRSNRSRRRSR